MYYLCFARHVSNIRLDKFRLCSSNLTSCYINNLNINEKRTYEFNTQKRNFSLQSTIESLVKTQSGIFKSISESVPVSYVQEFVLSIHSYTGLPWWASIILTTVVLRTFVTVPLALYQNYILAKVENLGQEMPGIVEELKKETAIAIRKFKWDEKTAKFMFHRSVCISK